MSDILIIEDEKSISDLILMNLKLVGYTCRQVFDAREAKLALSVQKPDLILLDVMLPFEDGFSLMEQNAFADVPVIFLTAKDSTADKVKGLNLGAYDYIVKPFETAELLARVRSVLRCVAPAQKQIFTVPQGTLSVNFDSRTVTLNDIAVELTNREFELLEALINNRNIALSREKLLDLVWGYDYYGDTRTVDVHITKLRKKTGINIKTVYKVGYRFEV